jgi:peptidase E
MVSPSPELSVPLNAVLIGGGQPQGTASVWPEKDPLLDAGLELTQPEVPSVLLITSARWKSAKTVTALEQGYANYYERRGAKMDILHPYLFAPDQPFDNPKLANTPLDASRVPSPSELTEKIEAADMVFVLGGDANRMLNQIWRPLGIDTLLKRAAERGTVISGVSAGCLAWFEGGHTDSSSLYANPDKPTFDYLPALGWIASAVCCPHYDQSPKGRSRQESFEAMMADREQYNQLGVAIDNNVALKITNGQQASVLTSNAEGRKLMHTLYYQGGVKHETTIDPSDGPFTLAELA